MAFDLDDIDLEKNLGNFSEDPQSPEGKGSEEGEIQTIFDPTTGQEIDTEDFDGMIDAYERIKSLNDSLYAAQKRIRYTLGRASEGDAKTRRIRGNSRCVAITMPGIKFSSSILKQAWKEWSGTEDDRQMRDELLRVDTVAVNQRDWKKARGTRGNVRFEALKSMIARAEELSDAPPTVRIEK